MDELYAIFINFVLVIVLPIITYIISKNVKEDQPELPISPPIFALISFVAYACSRFILIGWLFRIITVIISFVPLSLTVFLSRKNFNKKIKGGK